MQEGARRELCESLAANLRYWRSRRGFTQEDLAERAGLSTRQLQAIETGQVDVPLSRLVGLLEALDVTFRQLVRPAKLPPRPAGRPRKQPASPRRAR